MKQIFLDTNIVLDFILKREGFAKYAAQIFELAAKKKLAIYVSSLSINNIDYVISKLESAKKSREVVTKLITLLEILPVGKSTIEKAVSSGFKDFEDAIQNFCADEASINQIITRDLKGFKKSGLNILTSREFVAIYNIESSEEE